MINWTASAGTSSWSTWRVGAEASSKVRKQQSSVSDTPTEKLQIEPSAKASSPDRYALQVVRNATEASRGIPKTPPIELGNVNESAVSCPLSPWTIISMDVKNSNIRVYVLLKDVSTHNCMGGQSGGKVHRMCRDNVAVAWYTHQTVVASLTHMRWFVIKRIVPAPGKRLVLPTDPSDEMAIPSGVQTAVLL
jgi:hypothetical protein